MMMITVGVKILILQIFKMCDLRVYVFVVSLTQQGSIPLTYESSKIHRSCVIFLFQCYWFLHLNLKALSTR